MKDEKEVRKLLESYRKTKDMLSPLDVYYTRDCDRIAHLEWVLDEREYI